MSPQVGACRTAVIPFLGQLLGQVKSAFVVKDDGRCARQSLSGRSSSAEIPILWPGQPLVISADGSKHLSAEKARRFNRVISAIATAFQGTAVSPESMSDRDFGNDDRWSISRLKRCDATGDDAGFEAHVRIYEKHK